MKKFLVKFVVACLVLITLLSIANFSYITTTYYKELNGMQQFRNLPQHVEVANFGASHSAGAFAWHVESDIVGVNLAIGSQTLLYDEAWLNYYFDRFDENSTVIFEIMYKSLYEEETDEIPTPSKITRYYQVLPPSYIKQRNWKDIFSYYCFPILGNREKAIEEIRKVLSTKVFYKKEPIAINQVTVSTEPSQVEEGFPTQVLDGWTEADMIAEGNRRANSFMEQSGNQELGEQYDALIRMINKCKEKNIQILLVTVPTLPCFYEGFTPEFKTKFYEDINLICKQYDLQYIDYTGDERFLKDYRLFQDTDHLNAKGGEFFTKLFLEDNRELLQQE